MQLRCLLEGPLCRILTPAGGLTIAALLSLGSPAFAQPDAPEPGVAEERSEGGQEEAEGADDAEASEAEPDGDEAEEADRKSVV